MASCEALALVQTFASGAQMVRMFEMTPPKVPGRLMAYLIVAGVLTAVAVIALTFLLNLKWLPVAALVPTEDLSAEITSEA